MVKISAKWGFGNAPLKDHHREKTVGAIRVVLDLITDVPSVPTQEQLDAISMDLNIPLPPTCVL